MEQSDMLDAAEAALSVMFEDAHEAPERSTEPAEAPPGDTPELTIDALGRAHGEDGKFVPQPEDPTEEEVPADVGIEPEEEAPPAPEDYVLEVDDPELLELIDSKYGGDVLKALNALKDSQSLIGRQGQELGELRDLREQMASFQQEMAQQQRSQSINWEEMIEENPEQAAIVAFEYGNMDVFGDAVNALYETNPFRANMMMQALAQIQQQPAPVEEPTQSLEVEVNALKGKYPDLQQRIPAIQELAAERPLLAQMLQSGDPHSRAQALEDLYFLAKSRTLESDTSTAARKISLRAKVEADAARADATVVSASKSSAAEAANLKPNEKLEEFLGGIFGVDSVPIN